MWNQGNWQVFSVGTLSPRVPRESVGDGIELSPIVLRDGGLMRVFLE